MATHDDNPQHVVQVHAVDAVRLRYRSRAVPCRIDGGGEGPVLELDLEEPVDGAAPGQAACLLRGDAIVGWATIDSPAR